jgi:hypothetical protein
MQTGERLRGGRSCRRWAEVWKNRQMKRCKGRKGEIMKEYRYMVYEVYGYMKLK